MINMINDQYILHQCYNTIQSKLICIKKERKHYRNDVEYQWVYHGLKIYFGLYTVKINI